MNLKSAYGFRDTVKSFSSIVIVKIIPKLNMEHSVKFEKEN